MQEDIEHAESGEPKAQGNKILIMGIAVLIIAAGAAGFYFMSERTPKPALNQPDLDRRITYSTDLSEVDKALYSKQLEDTISALKDDPANFALWIQLGITLSAAGDYEGAALSWQYAATISPDSAKPYENLGSLYGYYLHDSEKAEEYFLTAIEKNLFIPRLYIKLYEFYRDMGESEKASAIIRRGLDYNPGDSGLTQYLPK